MAEKGLPVGWVKKTRSFATSGNLQVSYLSPAGKIFRSLLQIARYLEALKENGGDEEDAYRRRFKTTVVPEGWRKETIRTETRVRNFFYSPKGYKFRTLEDVYRFIHLVNKHHNGNEDAAYKPSDWGGRRKNKGKNKGIMVSFASKSSSTPSISSTTCASSTDDTSTSVASVATTARVANRPSRYLELREQRVRRNQKRLQELGLVGLLQTENSSPPKKKKKRTTTENLSKTKRYATRSSTKVVINLAEEDEEGLDKFELV